jgi:hypothetical protein
MPARAGTLLYAPQARLVDCSSGRVIGTNVTSTKTQTDTVVSADLLSAKVTLVNTGPAQLQIVLNNQRFDPQDHKRPVFPPWKYNDFTKRKGSTQDSSGTYSLTFGQIVRLDLRYGQDDWVKMILARITDLSFSFSTSGATLTATGEDMLSALRIRPTDDIPHDSKQEETILDEELAASKIGVKATRGARGIASRGQTWTSRHQKTQTYLAYLTEIADRLDCELYVDFADRVAAPVATPGAAANPPAQGGAAIDVAKEVTVRMEPARSGITPTTRDDDWTTSALASGAYVQLQWGMNLIDFTPKLKVWDMPTSADASGSHPNRRGRADGKVTSDDIQNAIQAELYASPSYFFGADSDTDNTEPAGGSNLDQTRARMKALAVALKKVRDYLTVEAKSIGVPKLRPGAHVHIVGMRPPFDGFYYVIKTVHTLDGNGYRTDLSLRRPGMMEPAKYMTASSDETQEAQQRKLAAAGGGT